MQQMGLVQLFYAQLVERRQHASVSGLNRTLKRKLLRMGEHQSQLGHLPRNCSVHIVMLVPISSSLI